jgi:hypothetical protein
MEHITISDVLNETSDINTLQTKFLTSILMERLVKFLLFRDDETAFFDLTPYLREFKEKMDPVIDQIRSNIEMLNYKTGLGYGKSALFMYKTDLPENLW